MQPADLLCPPQFGGQNLPVQDRDRARRLPISGRGDVPVVGQMEQESLDLRRAHLARVIRTGAAHETVRPVDARQLGS